jgi:hypothetical protein
VCLEGVSQLKNPVTSLGIESVMRICFVCVYIYIYILKNEKNDHHLNVGSI